MFLIHSRKAFSLIEVLVATGISGILALAMSPMLIQMAGMQSRLETDALYSELATSVNINLKNGETCAGRITAAGFDLNDAQTADGTPISIDLVEQGNRLLADGSIYSIGPTQLNIESVRIANAAIANTDANSTVLTGDLLIGLAPKNVSSLEGGPMLKRKVSAGRLRMEIENATNLVQSCNTETNYNASAETCAQMGADFDPSCPASADGCCVWRFNENLGPIEFCKLGEAGYVDPDSGPVCEVANSSCPEAASGISLGNFDCAPVVSVADGDPAPPAPPIPSPPPDVGPGAPPPPPGIEPQCMARWQSYASCVATYNWSGAAMNCGSPPATTGCSVITNVPIPSPLPAAPTPTPAPVTCHCGSGTVNNGQYCGFCTLELDYGYGFLESIYEVRRCNNGVLTLVPNAIAVVPVTSVQCNGARRFLNDMGGENYAF